MQKRKKISRKKKRGFLLLDKVKTQLVEDGYTVNQDDEEIFGEESQIKDKELNVDDFDSLLSVDLEAQNEEPIICLKLQETQIKGYGKEDSLLSVDQVKIFEHFMSNHNVNNVAAQYEKACYAKSYNKRIQTHFLKKGKSKEEKMERSPLNRKTKVRNSFKNSKSYIPLRL